MPCLEKGKKKQTKTKAKIGFAKQGATIVDFCQRHNSDLFGKRGKKEEKQKPISTLPNMFEATCKY